MNHLIASVNFTDLRIYQLYLKHANHIKVLVAFLLALALASSAFSKGSGTENTSEVSVALWDAPSKNYVYVIVNQSQKKNVSITATSEEGETVNNELISIADNSFGRINTAGWKAGKYYIQVKVDNKIFNKQFRVN